jgi:outer membrane protein TolC
MFSKLVLLFIVLCIAMPVYSEVLTLDKTMQLALDHQPQLAAQQGLIDARRASITADQQLPDPKLKFGVSNVPLDTLSLTKDAMTQTSVSIEQRFPGGNKRALRGQLAMLNSEQSLADFDNNRREIRRAAGLAWLDVYLAEQSLRLLHEQQAAFRQQIAAANIAYRNAQATQDAVLSLQNGLTQLMDDELAKQAQINTARARLARWIGNVAQADMPQTMPNLPAVLSLNQLLKGLINHPQIRKYELTIALAQTEMDLAQADKIPDWTVELGYAKRGSAYPDMIAAQVSVDLPVFPKNRQDKNITGKQMMLESARYQREDALRNLTAELTGYYSDWEISQRRINLLASSALPVAQQRIAAVLISYQNNQSSMSNVIEAHHAELNLRLQLLEQNVAHERAQLQIAYYAGELS